MRAINTIGRLFSKTKKLKHIEPQSYIVLPEDAQKTFRQVDLSHLNIKNYKEIKLTYKKGIEGQPQPVSAHLGPIRIANPKVSDKTYRWCACGMSSKQPFCDASHEGSLFKPLRFTVEQKVDFMDMCGCKLSTKKPFCDGQTCKTLRQQTSESSKPKQIE